MARYIKTYKTRSNETIIPLKMGDVTVTAHFVNGNIREGDWAKLETKDPVVQFVIEKSPLYGKAIFLDSSIEIEGEEEHEMTAEEVTTLAEAKEYLSKKYGIERRVIASPQAVKGAIKRLGIELPNLQL